MILPILTYPDPLLSQVCASVTDFDDDLRQLVQDMRDTMLAAKGLGLAAPQVGKLLQVFVVRNGDDVLTFINPILTLAGDEVLSDEGCLSLPQQQARVPRWSCASIVAQDLNGDQFMIEAEGLPAIVLQHENDHLSGVTIAPYLVPYDAAEPLSP